MELHSVLFACLEHCWALLALSPCDTHADSFQSMHSSAATGLGAKILVFTHFQCRYRSEVMSSDMACQRLTASLACGTAGAAVQACARAAALYSRHRADQPALQSHFSIRASRGAWRGAGAAARGATLALLHIFLASPCP